MPAFMRRFRAEDDQAILDQCSEVDGALPVYIAVDSGKYLECRFLPFYPLTDSDFPCSQYPGPLASRLVHDRPSYRRKPER